MKFLVVLFYASAALLISDVARAQNPEDRLANQVLNADSCRCVSIIPNGGSTSGRAFYDVTNSCGALDISVGFAGDIARLSPDLRIGSWAKAGIIEVGQKSKIGTPEGWTIASIAAYELRNKWGKFECRIGAGISQQQIDALKASTEREKHSISFDITSNDSKDLYVKFFSGNRDVEWPGNGRAWPLQNSKPGHYSLTCKPAQLVCYAAWRKGDARVSWGMGQSGRGQCTDCCWTCGSGNHKFSLNEGQDLPPADQITFDVRSLDRNAVELEFYTEDASRAWPGGDQMYPLTDSEFHSHALTCQPGEEICYGAWRSGNSNKYWGVGRGGREGCSGCCAACGSGTHRLTLNDGGGSDSVSSGDVASVLGSVLGGLAAGAGAAGGFRTSVPTYRAPPAHSYGPGRAPPQSDISGTR